MRLRFWRKPEPDPEPEPIPPRPGFLTLPDPEPRGVLALDVEEVTMESPHAGRYETVITIRAVLPENNPGGVIRRGGTLLGPSLLVPRA